MKEFGQKKKMACVIAQHDLNSEHLFPSTYQRSAQSDNKKLQQKYLLHPEMTKNNKKQQKFYLNDEIWQKQGQNQYFKGLSFAQKVVFLQDQSLEIDLKRVSG